MSGDVGFIKGDGVGGVVQQQWWMVCVGKYYVQWVGVEVVVFFVEWGDYWVVDDVDEVNGDQFGGGVLFGLVVDVIDVMCIVQGDSCYIMLFCFFNV